MTVHVLATTPDGTRCALVTAKRLAMESDARIVLLIPRVTTLAKPFDPTSDERALLIRDYRTLAEKLGIQAAVLFCVCQRLDEVVHSMLGQSSIVVVGGRHNGLWGTREERLARRLTSEGYPIVFAQVGAEHAHPVAALASS